MKILYDTGDDPSPTTNHSLNCSQSKPNSLCSHILQKAAIPRHSLVKGTKIAAQSSYPITQSNPLFTNIWSTKNCNPHGILRTMWLGPPGSTPCSPSLCLRKLMTKPYKLHKPSTGGQSFRKPCKLLMPVAENLLQALGLDADTRWGGGSILKHTVNTVRLSQE
jgi:hypothetical protein